MVWGWRLSTPPLTQDLLTPPTPIQQSFAFFPFLQISLSTTRTLIRYAMDIPALQSFESLKKSMESMQSSFEKAMVSHRTNLIHDRQDFQFLLDELKEEEKRVINQMESLKKQEQDINDASSREILEYETSKHKVEELESQKVQMLQLQKDLNEKTSSLNLKIKEKNSLLEKNRENLDSQTVLNQSELSTYEQYLGLKIEAIKEDLLRFSFQYIDPHDYSRQVSFVLNLSGEDYKVQETQPLLSDDKVLLLEKNFSEGKQLSVFLKEIRSELRGALMKVWDCEKGFKGVVCMSSWFASL